MSAHTRDGLIREVTVGFLAALNTAQPADIEGMKTDLLEVINDTITLYNASLTCKDGKFKCISTLPNFVIVYRGEIKYPSTAALPQIKFAR